MSYIITFVNNSFQLVTLSAKCTESHDTVEPPSVRPSVCLSRQSTTATACGGFAAERRRVGDIDRQRRQRRPATNAGSVMLTAETRS